MAIRIRTSEGLLEHLKTYQYDGANVGSLLFEGGRLSYPGRRRFEFEMGYSEPYTLELEARVIIDLPRRLEAAIRILARAANRLETIDPTLELLWYTHSVWMRNGISLDRIVAALVTVQYHIDSSFEDDEIEDAASTMIAMMHAIGLPPRRETFEEIFDGAPPACVGLGMIDL